MPYLSPLTSYGPASDMIRDPQNSAIRRDTLNILPIISAQLLLKETNATLTPIEAKVWNYSMGTDGGKEIVASILAQLVISKIISSGRASEQIPDNEIIGFFLGAIPRAYLVLVDNNMITPVS